MSEHLTEERIEKFRHELGSPAERACVDRHLSECGDCRELLAQAWARSLAAPSKMHFEKPEEGFHLSYEQIEAFVDGLVDDIDREIVVSHTSLCTECALRVASLQKFAAEVAGAPAFQRVAAAPEPGSKATLWGQLSSLLEAWGLPLAGVAVAAVLVFAIAVGPTRVSTGGTTALRAPSTNGLDVVGAWRQSFAAPGCSSGAIRLAFQANGRFSVRSTASGCTTGAEQQNSEEITGHWELTPEDGSSGFRALFKLRTRVLLRPDNGAAESYHLGVTETEKDHKQVLEFGNAEEQRGESGLRQQAGLQRFLGDYERVQQDESSHP